MDKNSTLQSILNHLAQDAAHPSEIDLWPTIQTRLAGGKAFSQANAPKIKLIAFSSKHNRVVFICALTLFIALGMIIILPVGQAWANNILRFFTPSQSNTFLLPTQDAAPKINITPTYIMPTLAGCEDESAPLPYGCAVSKAEAALGFAVKRLPAVPERFSFATASADLNQSLIRITYARDGGILTITQRHGTSAASLWEANWGAVPVNFIEKVQINNFEGEYVRGMFVVKSQTGKKAEWEPDAPVQRLRWQDGNMLFEIQMAGLPGDNDLIGKDWMITLAESLN
jgi:hypothetical protein